MPNKSAAGRDGEGCAPAFLLFIPGLFLYFPPACGLDFSLFSASVSLSHPPPAPLYHGLSWDGNHKLLHFCITGWWCLVRMLPMGGGERQATWHLSLRITTENISIKLTRATSKIWTNVQKVNKHPPPPPQEIHKLVPMDFKMYSLRL